MKIVKFAFTMFFVLITAQLIAQKPARDTLKEQQIEESLMMVDPSLVAAFREGTIEMDKGNLALADSLYNIVITKVPTFDPALRRRGMVQYQLGNINAGIELCSKAIAINKSAYNLMSLAYCYSSKGDGQNLSEAISLLKQAQMLPDGNDPDILILLAQDALQANNIDDFRSATNDLKAKHLGLMGTHYFAAILAASDEDWELAQNEIQIAQSMGLQEDAVKAFMEAGVSSGLNKHKYTYYFIAAIGAWLVGLLLLFFVGKVLSNLTLRSIERQAALSEHNKKAQLLRPIYRLFMNIGGIYYYLSLPIILVLVVALVVALFFLFFYLGHIPLQLMIVLVIGSGLTIYGMVKSLLIKVDATDPGRKLEKEEAPELFKLVDEVAFAIGTRPIDEIRICPTTDLAVYERGSWKEKFQDKAKRVLILGIGVLDDFKQTDFCAVLAHEYGHFANRDTAGGDVALRVRNDMTKYFYALYAQGQNVWWNIAFHFLRLYNFIFRRISHGSTRLQEVLADDVAARTFGKLAFQNGLTYVIRRDIEFNMFANNEINEAKNSNRPFNNLYKLSGLPSESIDKEVDKILNLETTEDDTHPSPVDRFRYIANINCDKIDYNDFKIKNYFVNWDVITLEMTQIIEERVNRYR